METNSRKIRSKEQNKIPFLILMAVLVVVLMVVLVFALKGKGDEDGTEDTQGTQTESVDLEKWQEGIVGYNGKDYIYNPNIKVYLIMGIDKEGKVEKAPDQNSGGQSDSMFLLVADSKEKTMSVVSINRNTITRVESYYKDGISSGYINAQICVQHGFGDGMHLSCSRAVDAVSHLFYNLPIAGYMSIRLDAIPIMNDAVGGVEVTVLNDVSYPSKGVELKKGEKVTLNADQAYAYLRGRDQDEFDSATLRLRRQEQYMTAFSSKLKSIATSDLDAAINIYNSISDYTVSSIDFAALAAELKEYSFSSERMYSVPGETKMGEEFEEYHVDEKAFYDMIINVFYTEVTK